MLIPTNKDSYLTYFIALIWFVNGLFCKVLNLVPRHQEIVGRILGETYAREITFLIGLAEIAMTIWVLSRFLSRFNAVTQIVIILTMNVLEFMLAPDLLLWGGFNFVFASLFCAVIYCNEFISNKKSFSH